MALIKTYPKRVRQRGTIDSVCVICGKSFKAEKYSVEKGLGKHCSRACRNETYRRRATPIEQRFWKYVEKTEGCWLWTGGISVYGYGRINIGGKTIAAHRVAYLLTHGDIPKGMFVCHICDVCHCVNPSHLFLGTPKENTHDMLSKGRHWVFRGEDQPRAKVTSEQVESIRARANQGEKQAALAKEFKVDQSTISDIVRGEHWKHIPLHQ